MTVAIVAGALANKPGNGGEAWVRMSWARGLARLGFEVWFIEALAAVPAGVGAAADAEAWLAASPGPEDDGPWGALEGSDEVCFFRDVTRAFGLEQRALLRVGDRVLGPSAHAWTELAERCELLLNISGHLPPSPWFERARRRVYVDLDPGYTQEWHASGLLGDVLARHHAHYTVGLNVGTGRSSIRTGGVAWRPVLQPVVREDWSSGRGREDRAERGREPGGFDPSPGERPEPGTIARRVPKPVAARDGDRPLRFTTVASWRGAYGPLRRGDRELGVKAHEWRRFRDLPTLARPHRFEAALAIHEADAADRDALIAAGWTLQDPVAAAGFPERFRAYVTGSDAEFSVAQGVYVGTRCGWFSDRSARYLASGRPVLVQDTGFGDVLPTGAGLVSFGTPDEARRGARRIAANYAAHAEAARELAATYFDSDRVLGRMLDELDLCP